MLRRNTASCLAIACLALTASVHAAELPAPAAAAAAPADVTGAVGGGLGAGAQLPALPAVGVPSLDANPPATGAPTGTANEGSRSIGVEVLSDSGVALPGLEGTQPVQSSTAVKRNVGVSYRVNASRGAATKSGDLPAPGAALAGATEADVLVDVDGSTTQQLNAAGGLVGADASDGKLSRGVSLREQSALEAVPAAGEPLPTVRTDNRTLKLTLDTRGQRSERSASGKAGDVQQKLERKPSPTRQLKVEAESLPRGSRVETASE